MLYLDIPLLSLLIWTPLIGGVLLLFIDQKNDQLIKISGFTISTVTLFISIVLLINFDTSQYLLQFNEKHIWIYNLDINYHLAVDGFSLLFILLTTTVTSLIILFNFSESRQQNNKYIALFLILEGLLLGVFCAFDSILFYIFFEAMLIPLFLIIGIWGGPNRVYATIKFFIYTLLGSVLMLVALLYLSFKANSFYILDYYNLVLSLDTQILIFLAFLIAFGIKVPMWPVHTWLPDAHVEAPSSGSVILAAVLLKVGGYGMIRFLLPITPDAGLYLNNFLIPLSLVAIIYISFVAIAQQDMKKLIAYSSIAHMGFVTLGIFLVFNTIGQAQDIQNISHIGLQGAIMQMLSHGLISAGLFICIGIIYSRTKSRMIDDQSGIGQVMPVFSALMMFFLLANSGLPGTSGFVGEFMVLIAAIKNNIMYAVLASTTLVLAASYSLWLGKRVLFGEVNNDNVASMKILRFDEFWPLLILAILVILIGIKPDLLLNISEESSMNMIKIITNKY
ncbi:MAG: NADH-quinone oxidoreductase subunit M [Gammaproteobacteria bacterium]|jgi:NADH-quinone oxidoreductase subunit M|nr:NADH-quinone oxidoreductase subunit M [Gammaproteobacteria bacterium]